jgi:hypothetical protein
VLAVVAMFLGGVHAASADELPGARVGGGASVCVHVRCAAAAVSHASRRGRRRSRGGRGRRRPRERRGGADGSLPRSQWARASVRVPCGQLSGHVFSACRNLKCALAAFFSRVRS